MRHITIIETPLLNIVELNYVCNLKNYKVIELLQLGYEVLAVFNHVPPRREVTLRLKDIFIPLQDVVHILYTSGLGR